MRLQRGDLAEAGQRGLAPVGLLEEEPALTGAAGGADDLRWVRLLGQGEGDAREHLPPAAPGPPDREREACGQALTVFLAQREDALSGWNVGEPSH